MLDEARADLNQGMVLSFGADVYNVKGKDEKKDTGKWKDYPVEVVKACTWH